MAVSINLKKFDLNELNKPKNVLIIGRRGTGKTQLLKHLIKYKEPTTTNITVAVHNYWECGNYETVLSVKRTDIKEVDFNELCAEHLKYQKKTHASGLLALDTVAITKEKLKNRHLCDLVSNGNHHYNTSLYMMEQSIHNIDPTYRMNCDYVFLFKDNNLAMRKRFYNYFGRMFSTFKEFNTVFEHVTSNYGVMVINTTAKFRNLESQVFWYKASLDFSGKWPPSFKPLLESRTELILGKRDPGMSYIMKDVLFLKNNNKTVTTDKSTNEPELESTD